MPKDPHVLASSFLPNPLPISWILKGVGALCRVLLKAEVPDYLLKRAAQTENVVDDCLAKMAASVIRGLAEL